VDNITRTMLDDGTLASYISDYSVTGLTSNPTIFDTALTGSADYDEQIRSLLAAGTVGENLFFELALADLTKAASLFRAIFDATNGVDGWVSLEVSPKLAHDTKSTVDEAKALHEKAATPNLFIKVPGTPEGIPAIEELIAAGVSVNVTLLFSREHYQAAADAYVRGLERRKESGLDLDVSSVASVFISRWDAAVAGVPTTEWPARRSGRRGPAGDLDLKLFDRFGNQIASSTGTADGEQISLDGLYPDTYYIHALASERTINTMPEKTLLAFGEHGAVGDLLPADAGDAEEVLARIGTAGIDVDALAAQLQDEGAAAFVKSGRPARLHRIEVRRGAHGEQTMMRSWGADMTHRARIERRARCNSG
jgi:transaldolase